MPSRRHLALAIGDVTGSRLAQLLAHPRRQSFTREPGRALKLALFLWREPDLDQR